MAHDILTPAVERDFQKGRYRYRAFISYSHSDGRSAEKLHRSLETFVVPKALAGRESEAGPVPARLFPIFRDRDELSAGPDLDAVIVASLQSSQFLIVLCSTKSAKSTYVNKEIEIFKEMGRGDRIIFAILDGEPTIGAENDCFPPAARTRGDGTPSTPIASDFRPSGDGWNNGILKIAAQLLGVPLDDLKRRDEERRRRQKRRRSLAYFSALIALLFAYVLACDAGLPGLGGDAIRGDLDDVGITAFRPAPSPDTVRATAARFGEELAPQIIERLGPQGMFNDTPNGETPGYSTWSQSDDFAALLSDASLKNDSLDKFLKAFDFMFTDEKIIERNNSQWYWHDVYGNVSSFCELWMAMALFSALQRPDVISDATWKPKLESLAVKLEDSIQHYRSDKPSGAYDTDPDITDRSQHSVYATTLALYALTAAYRADQPWDGSKEQRDLEIKQTYQWLLSQFQSSQFGSGFVDNVHDENSTNALDGLTAQTYTVLLEVTNLPLGLKLPKAIRLAISKYIEALASRELDYPVDQTEKTVGHLNLKGAKLTSTVSVRFLWWPWTVLLCDEWLKHATGENLTSREELRARRSFAHLVTGLGPTEMARIKDGWRYVLAEHLYALNEVLLPVTH